MSQDAYQLLEKKFKRIYRLRHLADIANWDEAVMMPAGSGEARAAALAELKVVVVEALNDPQMGDWIEGARAQAEQLNSWQKANLREIEQAWRKATSVSPDLVEAMSRASSRCEQAWRRLRPENDWASFKPLLEEVVQLSREEAAQRAQATGLTEYDSLLNLYEPGLTSAAVDQVFAGMMNELPGLIQKVNEKQSREEVLSIKGTFPVEKQRALGLEFMKAVGFDFNCGRLDVSHHPFCGGTPEDIRLTTRYVEDDFAESLMGVLHETGHASYEQGLPREWIEQPVGSARSMSIHEGQSLLFEMQVSRGLPFLTFAAPIIQKHLGDCVANSADWTPQALFQLYTRVQPDFIRVNADEVTYPAHIVLRYEIEKALIEKSIEVADVPELWDEKMKDYLGVSTAGDYKNGCMQDVHWPSGAFGYFPTYTLGAMTAAQLYQAMLKDVPELESEISRGNFTAMRRWLEAKVWKWGSYYQTPELLKEATGETLNPTHFMSHLKQRYL